MNVRVRHLCVLLLVAALLCGCSAPREAEPQETSPAGVSLTLLGIAAGSTMQLKANAVAEAIRLEHPEWQVTSMAAGGEARLIEKRIAGEADLYFSNSLRSLEVEVFTPLHPGIDFEQATAYRLVMPSSPAYVQLLARGDTGLTTPADIVERKYAFTMGSGAGITRQLFDRILRYYGASVAESEAWGAKYETMISVGQEGVEALQSGRTNMGFTCGPVPAPALMGVTFDLRLLPLSDPGLVDMLGELGCVPATIRAGTFPFVTADVATVMSTESLVARPDLPDHIVYGVCEAVFNHLDILVAAHAPTAAMLAPDAIINAVVLAGQSGQQYHPGALAYYRDRGWIH